MTSPSPKMDFLLVLDSRRRFTLLFQTFYWMNVPTIVMQIWRKLAVRPRTRKSWMLSISSIDLRGIWEMWQSIRNVSSWWGGFHLRWRASFFINDAFRGRLICISNIIWVLCQEQRMEERWAICDTEAEGISFRAIMLQNGIRSWCRAEMLTGMWQRTFLGDLHYFYERASE